MLKQGITIALLAGLSGGSIAASLPISSPCELSQSALPANFQGHSADDIARELKRTITRKDEYESEAAYTARVNQSLSELKSAISDGKLCVVDKNIGLGNTEYDAESQTLWANVFLKSANYWFDGENLHQDFQIYVSERNRKDSSYVASNAFGASADVSKLERDATYVTFDSEATTAALKAAGIQERDRIYLSVPIGLTSSEARALHGNIRVAYQYRLKPPYIGTYDDFELPKLDWPFESRERQTLVVAELVAITVFDLTTGSVLKHIVL